MPTYFFLENCAANDKNCAANDERVTILIAVLVSNLGGITGTLLGLDNGTLAAKLHLDVLYPVKGFKRCLDARNGFGTLQVHSLTHLCLQGRLISFPVKVHKVLGPFAVFAVESCLRYGYLFSVLALVSEYTFS